MGGEWIICYFRRGRNLVAGELQNMEEGLPPISPAIGCRPPPKEKKMSILPAEQIGVCLSAAEEHGVLPTFRLELTTGLRRGRSSGLILI